MGAVANEMAAELYGLEIVRRAIHDYPFNHTRFIALSNEELHIEKTPDFLKSTIMVTLPTDKAGSLHQVLSAFAWRKINLSKLESRPLKTGLGNYFFMIDLNHSLEEKLVRFSLEEIHALGCTVKELGPIIGIWRINDDRFFKNVRISPAGTRAYYFLQNKL